jgi:hypothetical protein
MDALWSQWASHVHVPMSLIVAGALPKRCPYYRHWTGIDDSQHNYGMMHG